MSDAAPRFNILLALRTLIGLLLAPAIGGAVAMMGLTLTDGHSLARGDLFYSLRNSLTLGLSLGGMMGAVPAVLIGWPVHLLLLQRRATHAGVYAALGAVIAIPGGIIGAAFFGLGTILGDPFVYLILSVAGAVGGFIFWLIRQPQRDAPRNPPPSEATP